MDFRTLYTTLDRIVTALLDVGIVPTSCNVSPTYAGLVADVHIKHSDYRRACEVLGIGEPRQRGGCLISLVEHVGVLSSIPDEATALVLGAA